MQTMILTSTDRPLALEDDDDGASDKTGPPKPPSAARVSTTVLLHEIHCNRSLRAPILKPNSRKSDSISSSRNKHFTVSSMKDIFDNVAARNIINFIKESHFYSNV